GPAILLVTISLQIFRPDCQIAVGQAISPSQLAFCNSGQLLPVRLEDLAIAQMIPNLALLRFERFKSLPAHCDIHGSRVLPSPHFTVKAEAATISVEAAWMGEPLDGRGGPITHNPCLRHCCSAPALPGIRPAQARWLPDPA